MNAALCIAAWWVALAFGCLACASCTRTPSPLEVSQARIRERWVRCTFDSPWPADASALEARLRVEVRVARFRLAERAGRCQSILRDSSLEDLAVRWDATLPLIQATPPDTIAIEQSIRRIGNAWRAHDR